MANRNYTPITHLTQLLQDDLTLANPAMLVRVLRHIANRVEATIPPRPSPTLLKAFPKDLDSPETAWPWLVAHKPELFAGIPLHTEPYFNYLKQNQPDQDAALIAHLDQPSQADVAKILFDDRTKTGGSYRRRILAALEAVKLTTTTPARPDERPQIQKAA